MADLEETLLRERAQAVVAIDGPDSPAAYGQAASDLGLPLDFADFTALPVARAPCKAREIYSASL